MAGNFTTDSLSWNPTNLVQTNARAQARIQKIYEPQQTAAHDAMQSGLMAPVEHDMAELSQASTDGGALEKSELAQRPEGVVFGVRTRAVRNRTLRPNGTGTMS